MGCLPIEVRLQIYDYALVSMLVGPLHLNVDHKTRCLVKAQDAAVYPRGALNGWHGPVNLLAMAFTCRQG